MNVEDPRAGGIPADSSHEDRSPDSPSRLSRRDALQKLGLGVAGGVAAWVAPEILIGRPSAAGAASAAPTSATSSPGATSGPRGTAAPSQSTGGGEQLAFTGLNVDRALEAGAGLLVGGWILTRWSSARQGDEVGEQSAEQNPPTS
jgi:hypothetical protein